MTGYFVHSVTNISDQSGDVSTDRVATINAVEFGDVGHSRHICTAVDAKTASDIAAAMNLCAALDRYIVGTVAADIMTNGAISNELRLRIDARIDSKE